MTSQNILEFVLETLTGFDPESKIIESAVVCEFSAEDSTHTLHLSLWRGNDLCDLPDTSLEIVAEGFNNIGRVYSLQPKN